MRFLKYCGLFGVLVLHTPALSAMLQAEPTLATVAEIRAFADTNVHQNANFSLKGTILYTYSSKKAGSFLYVLDDGTGCMIIRVKIPPRPLVSGDRVTISGIMPPTLNYAADLLADRMEIIGHDPPPPPNHIAIGDLRSARDNLKFVETEGLVEDVFNDDADPNWRILQLRDSPAMLTVSLPHQLYEKTGGPALLGARVRVSGAYCNVSSRRLSGWRIVMNDRSSLSVMMPARADQLDAPPLAPPPFADPQEIVALGRRSVTGRVRAAWQRRHLLLAADNGELLRIDLVDGESAPRAGTRVKAVGYAETDLYRINLSRARIRILGDEPSDLTRQDAASTRRAHGAARCRTYVGEASCLPMTRQDAASTRRTAQRGCDVPSRQKKEISIKTRADEGAGKTLTLNDVRKVRSGGYGYNDTCFGQTLHAEGVVQSVPSRENGRDFLVLTCDSIDLKVDLSACPEAAAQLIPGCRVAISGICILEMENWRPTLPFPPITGVIVTVRQADDLLVLSRPSPWTKRHLFILLGTLLLALGGLFVWNQALKRLADQRGRALNAETLARAESELKVYERTRLAVELHDSISQNLTGATMAMRVVREMVGPAAKASRHIDLALKTIDSTRTELRNCIWDLRHDTLGLNDFAEAVRTTLAPFLGNTTLALRFTVPRERLSDNTAHTILRIIRELVSNAIRHGNAENVRVAGAIEGQTLLFSVTDDGCGFDPKNHPGMEDGHFGLEGVRERAASLGGKLVIESRPGGHRTRIALSLTLPREEPA